MKRTLILLGMILTLIAVAGSGGSTEQAAAIPSASLCGDYEDNDGDGKIDAQVGGPANWDPECSDVTDHTEWRIEYAPNQPQCSDMIDNDGDGGYDWADVPDPEFTTLRDTMCTSPSDNDELSNPEVCSNGLDDDSDGLIDFGSDPGCYANEDTDEGDVAACANGVDDDGDNLADGADPGCEVPWDTDEQHFVPEPGETVEELTAEGDVDLTCYPTLGDSCPTFFNSSQAAAGPTYLHFCRVRTTRPFQVTPPGENLSLMHGTAAYGCNVAMRSVRICGQLWRSTSVEATAFVAAGPFDCTQQFFQTGGVFSTTYECVFFGFPNHTRTWFMQINVQATFPSGNTQTQQWRTSRTSAQCH